jgi:pimeloyl-ACP methyl ester carboxylesterase
MALSPRISFSAAQSGERKHLPSSPATAEYLEVENGRVFYEVFGDGFPVVFIHDGIAHREVWDNQVADFAQDYRVIRYDRRGYGRSDMPDTSYSNLADLHALVEHLKLERAVFIGSSSGGGLAIDYALEHPDRVMKLIPVAPGLSGHDFNSEPEQKYMQDIGAAFAAADFDRAAEVFLVGWTVGPTRRVEDLDSRFLSRVRTLIRENIKPGKDSGYPTEADPPAVKRLSEIKAPTLVVVGDLDMPGILDISNRIEKEVRGSRRFVIKGAAHTVNMEKPEKFNKVVMEFLAK